MADPAAWTWHDLLSGGNIVALWLAVRKLSRLEIMVETMWAWWEKQDTHK